MSININRAVQDVFYRYKMPPVQAKVEGRGNGIKTVIPNMVEIARALERPPTYPTKYFGCELGAQVQMDAKNERYIVNGAHDANRLQDLLDGFIKKFVLCPECDNPETKLRVTSKRDIEQTCIACGNRGLLDMSHKLTTFIVNNPPNEPKSKKSKEDKRAGKLTSSARDNVQERAEGGNVEAPEIDETVNDEDVEWSEDTSEESVRRRQEALSSGVAGLTLTEDLELSEEERLELLQKFVQRVKDQTPLPELDILAEAERLDVKGKAVLPISFVLWNSSNFLPSIKKTAKLLRRFTAGSKKIQRVVIGAVEKYVGLEGSLLAAVPAVFKFLYDEDIVEEEAFIAWADKGPSSKYVKKKLSAEVHEKATRFIQWLREAETESDSGDDEDDEENGVAVSFDTNANGVTVESNGSPDEDDAEEEEDELDIDNI